MDERLKDLEVREIFRSWTFDLHRSGRALSTQTQREIEQIAVLVVGSGGSLRDAFSAARGILTAPARAAFATT